MSEDRDVLRDEDDYALVYLDWYARAIRRRWLLIVAGTVLGGAISFWYVSLQPLRYQGVTTLLVVPPSEPGGAQINLATFRSIVENGTLASQVIAELALGDELSPQTFIERALSVEEVRGTNIVRVKVTLPDPGKAADASRRLAHKAILLTQRITQQEGAAIQEQLKSHLSDAHERLRSAETELLAYKQDAQVEVIKGDADAQLKERSALLSLVVTIESERARLSAAEAEIKRQQPLLTAIRMPAAEDALRRAAAEDALRRATAEDALRSTDAEDALRRADARAAPEEADAQHLDLSNRYVNPVYQTLDFQIATSRTRIAALERQRDELVNVKKIGGKELEQLNELYRRQIALARLQANFDLATKVYDELSLRFEQSRTRPFGTTAQLQIVDDALPPDRPVSRMRLQYGAVGAVFGLIGMLLVILFWARSGTRSQQNAA
jgi:uncharacterized protein involved in exopolysaccharide biosynthesis